MKLKSVALLWFGIAFLCSFTWADQIEDDDFSEFDDDFEEIESERFKSSSQAVKNGKDEIKNKKEEPKKIVEKISVKDPYEEDEEVFVEDDDFEGIDEEDFFEESEGRRKDVPPPKLTITPVPVPIRGWQAYWSEILMFLGICVYMMNYVLGRYKNQRIAQAFFDIHWNLLDENFVLLGDSYGFEEDQGTNSFKKMSDSIFQIWCSGRVCCEGMLVELKLLKRQDIISILANIFKPSKDTLRVTVEMGKEDMDSIIFAIATKKTAVKITKELNDLSNYCPDKKPGDKFGLPPQFSVMSEIGEVASSMLDSRTCAVINKFASCIESIHITDQFTGTKATEPELDKDGVMKMPEARRLMIFTLTLDTSMSGNNAEQVFEDMKPLLQFIFYTIDRIRKVRLSREGKAKADKNRIKMEELYIKQTHAARAEAAAARREEKRRQEKERMLQEDDPDKQRRWEEKEMKREKKKKNPRMKQIKVKAM